MKTLFTTVTEVNQQRSTLGKPYREFLRVPAMSAGLYVLAAGATDLQRPHSEDEMYYVVRGKARFRAGEEDREVSAGRPRPNVVLQICCHSERSRRIPTRFATIEVGAEHFQSQT